ncbi:MAG: hypothetical protein ABEK17_01285, partial [Candidatus Aenigmatarchaeota archaeon]
FQNLWSSMVNFAPNLVGAVVVLLIGWIVGRIIGKIVKEVLTRAGIDEYLKKEEHISIEASELFDLIARWAIYILALGAATEVLGIASITSVMNQILAYIPGIIGAIAAVLVSYGLGIYAKEQVISKKTPYADITGKVVFFLVLYIGISIALEVLKFPVTLINNILLILVGSAGVGIAIALGLGLKDVIQKMAEDYAEEFKEKRKEAKE